MRKTKQYRERLGLPVSMNGESGQHGSVSRHGLNEGRRSLNHSERMLVRTASGSDPDLGERVRAITKNQRVSTLARSAA